MAPKWVQQKGNPSKPSRQMLPPPPVPCLTPLVRARACVDIRSENIHPNRDAHDCQKDESRDANEDFSPFHGHVFTRKPRAIHGIRSL